jgi:8-oxo-dGTP pyrophosphatase MutT (NUDIX family)
LYEETGLQICDHDVQFVGAKISSSRILAGEIEAGLILFVYKCRWESVPEIHLSPEHSDFRWATPDEAREALQFHISLGFIPKEEDE